MVNINQKGVFFMSQAVARQMVKQRAGVIVNVSSESGPKALKVKAATPRPRPRSTALPAPSKELGKYGIRVVGVAPGILENRSADTGI